jgi:hypothetical protein
MATAPSVIERDLNAAKARLADLEKRREQLAQQLEKFTAAVGECGIPEGEMTRRLLEDMWSQATREIAERIIPELAAGARRLRAGPLPSPKPPEPNPH